MCGLYTDFIILQVMNKSCSLLFLVSYKMDMKLSSDLPCYCFNIWDPTKG